MPNTGVFLLTLLGCLMLLMPRQTPGKWLGLIFLLPLFFYQPVRPGIGEYWLTVLDVGQGLSVVVQTHQHTLVFDAGLKYGDQWDMGASVVLPFLLQQRIHQIDALVISHHDSDHSGGANALIFGLPVLAVFTTAPETVAMPSSLCLAGQQWQWDGVQFDFLFPDPAHLTLDNNSSCVLRIHNSAGSALLPGDIEKYAETRLVASGQTLSADILLAPHHGSQTSGLLAFIDAVHPSWVVYATGYLNRYHFPHESVILSYQAIHARQLNTAREGEIQFRISKTKILNPLLYREQYQRFYRH